MAEDQGKLMDRPGPVPARTVRRFLAFLLAPLGAGVAATVVLGLGRVLTRGLDPAPWTAWRWFAKEELLGPAVGVTVFSAPYVWLIAPFAVAWLLKRGFRSWLAFGVMGAALGGGVFVALAVLRIFDDPGIALVPLGAACGFAAALTYWCIDVRPDRSTEREG
ncbi:MAG TPA: hypothetical protein VFY71_05700 [Planctomycetota bacterium]|nr:hypothetical protein [Planctomycetota bacterium]